MNRLAIGWRQIGAVVAILFVALLVMDKIAPYRQPMPSTDSGVFLYIGDLLLEGKLPYRDAWDHKAPLIYVFNALGLLIRPDSLWGVWLLQYLAVSLAAAVGYQIIRKAFGFGPAIFGTSIWLFGLTAVLDGGNLTEVYALPFQFATLWFFWKGLEKKNDVVNSLWIGLCAAMAFWLRANIVGAQLAIGLVLAWQFLLEKDRRVLHKIGAMLIGWMLVSGAILSWFAAHDSLAALIDNIFAFNFVYSRSSWADKWSSLLVSLRIIPLGATFAFAGWTLACSHQLQAAQSKSSSKASSFGLVLLVLLPIELVLANLSGRAYPHYFMSLLPIYALLSSYFLYALGQLAKEAKAAPSFRPALLLGLLASTFLLPLHSLWVGWLPTARTVLETRLPPAPQFGQHTSRVLAYLKETLTPDDYLILWGRNLSLNWFTGHKVPSVHIAQDYFFTEDYASVEMISGYIEDLETYHPVIIDTTRTSNFIPSIGTRLDKLPQLVHPLYIYLETNYVFIEEIPGTEFAVFRHKDTLPPQSH